VSGGAGAANAAGPLNPSDASRCRSAACRCESGGAVTVEKVRIKQRWAIFFVVDI
jgi:hypothetical protein